jgi:hypothetical protein
MPVDEEVLLSVCDSILDCITPPNKNRTEKYCVQRYPKKELEYVLRFLKVVNQPVSNDTKMKVYHLLQNMSFEPHDIVELDDLLDAASLCPIFSKNQKELFQRWKAEKPSELLLVLRKAEVLVTEGFLFKNNDLIRECALNLIPMVDLSKHPFPNMANLFQVVAKVGKLYATFAQETGEKIAELDQFLELAQKYTPFNVKLRTEIKLMINNVKCPDNSLSNTLQEVETLFRIRLKPDRHTKRVDPEALEHLIKILKMHALIYEYRNIPTFINTIFQCILHVVAHPDMFPLHLIQEMIDAANHQMVHITLTTKQKDHLAGLQTLVYSQEFIRKTLHGEIVSTEKGPFRQSSVSSRYTSVDRGAIIRHDSISARERRAYIERNMSRDSERDYIERANSTASSRYEMDRSSPIASSRLDMDRSSSIASSRLDLVDRSSSIASSRYLDRSSSIASSRLDLVDRSSSIASSRYVDRSSSIASSRYELDRSSSIASSRHELERNKTDNRNSSIATQMREPLERNHSISSYSRDELRRNPSQSFNSRMPEEAWDDLPKQESSQLKYREDSLDSIRSRHPSIESARSNHSERFHRNVSVESNRSNYRKFLDEEEELDAPERNHKVRSLSRRMDSRIELLRRSRTNLRPNKHFEDIQEEYENEAPNVYNNIMGFEDKGFEDGIFERMSSMSIKNHY